MKSTTSRSRASVPSSTEAPPVQRVKGNTKIFPFLVVALSLAVAVVIFSRGSFSGKKSATGAVQGSSVTKNDDISQLIQRVAKHIVINQSEQPTVATIQDENLLRAQNPIFYKDAQKGDRLLIWSDKAVLYSPAHDVLLAVLPVNLPVAATQHATTTAAFQGGSPSMTSSTPSIEHATVEVRNGSPTPGVARELATVLKDAGFDVLTPVDAKSKNYPTTVIVKANNTASAKTLAELQALTHAEVVAAPAVEGAIKGDFLIIVGANYRK